jgi:LPS export ABC transporter protein LptC
MLSEPPPGPSTSWAGHPPAAQILEDQKKAILQAPVIKFYENGEYASTLIAEKGRVNMENYDMWGDGECTLSTAKGERLETSNLYYHASTEKVTSNDRVTLIRPNEIVRGRGFEATPNLGKIVIRNQTSEIKK